jgi:uncharacterized protein (DUF1330 family)
MPAYVIASVEILDAEGYAVVRAGVRETIERYGGRYLALRGRVEVLEGNWAPRQAAIIEFPSYEDAVRWYESPEYAPLKRARIRTARSDLESGPPR